MFSGSNRVVRAPILAALEFDDAVLRKTTRQDDFFAKSTVWVRDLQNRKSPAGISLPGPETVFQVSPIFLGDRTMQDLKHKTEGAAQSAREFGDKTVNQAKDAATGVVDSVKDTFQSVSSSAAEFANKTAEQVRDTAKDWLDSAENATMNTARTVQHAAGDAADKVGDLSGELAKIIRRNPIPSALAAIGVGFLVAYACQRNSSS